MHVPHRFISCCLSLSAFVLLSSLPAAGQSVYPDTLWVPVTYYDFHWNYRAEWNTGVTIFRGNPDFEYGDYGSGGLVMGMVQDTLDSEFKPVLGPTVYFNAGIQYWFRPSTGPKGTFRRPAYRPDGGLSGWQTTTYDTPFVNIMIPDSLPFILKDSISGTYVFDSDTNTPYATMGGFFPLDGRGYKTEGATDVSVAPWGHQLCIYYGSAATLPV